MATLSTTGRNAACDAIVDLLDGGNLDFQNSGDSSLATCTFGTPAFGAAAVGVATANAIGSDTSTIAGTISKVIVETSGSTEIFECTAGVSGSGADFILSSLTLGTDETLAVSSMTVTVPAS